MSDPDEPASSVSDDPAEGDDWNPDEMEIEAEFGGDGAGGGAADVVETPGEFLTEDYWFEGEKAIRTTPGTPFLWAMSGAGLYAASFIFAALGLGFVAPTAAETYTDIVLGAVLFFPIPMIAFIAAGLGMEAYLARSDGDLPETTVPIALLVPVLLHVSLFFVEWVDTGYTDATLADLFARDPGLAQLLLWPPVIMGTIFAVIVYRTTLRGAEDEEDSLLEFA